MIVQDVRFDWLFVFDKNKNGKHSVCCLVPKDSPTLKKVEAAIEKAKATGLEKGLFTKAHLKSATFKQCLRDGDAEIETEERPKHYANCMFFNANNNDQPGILGPNGQPILDASTFYSGCYGHGDINFFPFHNKEHGSRGIGAGLNNIMKTKDGERLDGRQSAEDAFAGLEVEDDLQ